MQVKIVPHATPDADGEWIEVDVIVPAGAKWIAMEKAVMPFIPSGHAVVSVVRPGRDPRVPYTLNSTVAGT